MRWLFALVLLVPFLVFPGSPLVAFKMSLILLAWSLVGYALGSLLLTDSSWDLKLFSGMALVFLLAGFVLWLSGIIFGEYRYGYGVLALFAGIVSWLSYKKERS
jgi:hypothetical protein